MTAANADQRHYRIKAAQRDLIAACGGIQRSAEIVDFSDAQVGRWNNGAQPDMMPVHVALALEGECGMPLVTSAMASLNNRRLADPDGAVEAANSVMRSYTDVVRQIGEVMTAAALHLSDGQITPAEANEQDKLMAQLERLVGDHRKSLAQVKAVGGFTVVNGGAA